MQVGLSEVAEPRQLQRHPIRDRCKHTGIASLVLQQADDPLLTCSSRGTESELLSI